MATCSACEPARDAVARLVKAVQFPGVHVQQLPGAGTLQWRLTGTASREAGSLATPALL